MLADNRTLGIIRFLETFLFLIRLNRYLHEVLSSRNHEISRGGIRRECTEVRKNCRSPVPGFDGGRRIW